MDGKVSSPHEIVNPSSLAEPRGFSHAVVSASGRTIYLGGQAAHDVDGVIDSDDIVEQFDRAAANVVEALRGVGASAEHLVSLHIYVTDADAYRSSTTPLAAAYRKHFGTHYPAVALFEVQGLFDPAAKVELVGVAVVPESL